MARHSSVGLMAVSRLRVRAQFLTFLVLLLGMGRMGQGQVVTAPSPQKPSAPGPLNSLIVVEEKGLQRLQPNAAIFSFGAVDRFAHPLLEHAFTLRNGGKAAVVIDHLQPSCGCTSALLTSGRDAAGYTLEPGKQVGVQVTVDLTKLATGSIKKFLWVMVPHETTPAVSIRLDAEVEGVLTFTPPSLEFGKVEAGKSPGMRLSVMLDKRLIQAVGGVRLISSNPGLVITPAVPADTPVPGSNGKTVQRTYTVKVTNKADLGELTGSLAFVPAGGVPLSKTTGPGAKKPGVTGVMSGSHSASKHVKRTGGPNAAQIARPSQSGVASASSETSSAMLAAVIVPVTGQVLGRISSRPGRVVFGAASEGEATTRLITLVGTSASDLVNLKITCPSVWVTAKLSVPERTPPAPGSSPLPPMMLLEVMLSPKAPAGALSTKIVLTTEGGERLVLPAFGYITPAVK